jgi:hypothetical protein
LIEKNSIKKIWEKQITLKKIKTTVAIKLKLNQKIDDKLNIINI